MDKKELIDKAVEDLRGKIDALNNYGFDGYILLINAGAGYSLAHVNSYVADEGQYFCTIKEFNQRARELGWCNGYKYGVEYETNGKKPDLPDDVLVSATSISGIDLGDQYAGSSRRNWDIIKSFRIVDDHFKPVDADYFSESEVDENNDGVSISYKSEKSWHEKGELPPVGTECKMKHPGIVDWVKVTIECYFNSVDGHSMVVISGHNYDVWDENYPVIRIDEELEFLPLKTERERFVDVVTSLAVKNDIVSQEDLAGALYDAGFKAPE